MLNSYYFDNESVRKEDCCESIHTKVRYKSENALFLQNGASLHTSHDTRDLLRDIFGENWIGKFGPENWPTSLPDLTPLDVFVWRSDKDRVFKISANYLTQLEKEKREQ